MTRLLAFDQIEILLDQLSAVLIDYGVYKSLAEQFADPEKLTAALSAAKSDPKKRAEIEHRLGALREQLKEIAARLLIEDSELQTPPSTGRPN